MNHSPRQKSEESLPEDAYASEIQQWFHDHVTLDGAKYTLDLDQAKAVADNHYNALITARAGSGKTRVIVAKIAYLVAQEHLQLSEIVAFMFNRTAAAEVNARIGAVKIDGVSLQKFSSQNSQTSEIRVASTFHKFALDVVKRSGCRPQIISEAKQNQIIFTAFQQTIQLLGFKLSPQDQAEFLKLTQSFIARAGQKYTSTDGLNKLQQEVSNYCKQYQDDSNYTNAVKIHQVALKTYEDYLQNLNFPDLDFNLLMTLATKILQTSRDKTYTSFKYVMVDEYQDFSYLFFALVQALRQNCPQAHLFVVGDDWQAINRFAGSDVKYFLGFQNYFPKDTINIPLLTNYRSDRKIVENANHYMLSYYDPAAKPARAFSAKNGKIVRLNSAKVRFDATDILGDGLDDARYQKALFRFAIQECPELVAKEFYKKSLPAAKLLKQTVKLCSRHRHEQILLLHRHNFTTTPNVSLLTFFQALKSILQEQAILSPEECERQLRAMTMHKSKGLESDIVILLELNHDVVLSTHPHAQLFSLFGDNLATEKADQHRLLYVALTRAKHKLYLLSTDKKPPGYS